MQISKNSKYIVIVCTVLRFVIWFESEIFVSDTNASTALEDKGWSLEEVLDFVMNWIFLGGSWKRRFNGDEMMNEGKGEVIQNIERVVEPLPLMTYGLKLSLEAWILKFLKKSFNNLRFNELQLNFGNSIFFCKA